MPIIEPQILDRIQPVVLVGGRSTRFGRDKLIEPVDGVPMVAAPINALRRVFGPRVAIVGQCDPQIAGLADSVIEDPYPGLGPVGGLCAALEHAQSDVFVCAGDLVSIEESTIRAILAASIEDPDSLAFLAQTDRLHPVLGLYRARCAPHFKDAIGHQKLRLSVVLDQSWVRRVRVDPESARNINRTEDLGEIRDQ